MQGKNTLFNMFTANLNQLRYGEIGKGENITAGTTTKFQTYLINANNI
jgi:hypothetical protein